MQVIIIQAQVNPQDVTTLSSMKAAAAYLAMDTSETEFCLHENGNPDFVQNCDGDGENFSDTSQHPTDSESTDTAMVQNILEKKDKGNTNLTSIYDIFDDPT